jgi:hypothetical protein
VGARALRPHLDPDTDGLPSEHDEDNDGDGLEDRTELHGDAFDPPTATDVSNPDSDEDGAPDGDEALAGTHPNNASHQLRIVSVDGTADGVRIAWLARSNRTYRVRYDADLNAGSLFTGIVDTVTADGAGAGPWQVVTNFHTDPGGEPRKFYVIEVVP